MADPSSLRPDDRADFEAVLHHALSTADIRGAVGADPAGRVAAHLRAHALARADDMAAAAEGPYRSYLAVRRAARHERRGPLGTGSPLPVLSRVRKVPPSGRTTGLCGHDLAVLTPLVAGTSAAALLLTGGLLHLADTPGPLPGSLVAAGRALALVAAVTGLGTLAALLYTATRRRGVPPAADQVEHARLVWRQELPDRGMLPHLRRHLLPHSGTAITPCSPPDTLTSCPARAREDRTPCSD
ncbi:hypothetical protein [Streptomyces cahuitamycinicus]|uniref:Uncharacterized protein n=1 Tax=Streptomyces cahuitamycinicus TaxID=2070367 RepID=A0A2N8TPK5_9ACTN|nr:hypothetical protein [Streptomyces cahuitamycinicus]PNG20903.1 hypothetical protein C1J00_17660 [Streptomyces cahuitamycinicus]